MTQEVAQCAHCDKAPRLTDGGEIYPHRGDLHSKKFWKCDDCNAYVGCHREGVGFGDGTKPLGRAANAGLRRARGILHGKLDPLWKRSIGKAKGRARKQVYKLLRSEMKLTADETHVAMFDLDQCRKAWIALDVVSKKLSSHDDAPIVEICE